MVSASLRHFRCQKVSKQHSNAGVYQAPDSVWFDRVQITDVPELVPVHLWLNHTITSKESKAGKALQLFVTLGAATQA